MKNNLNEAAHRRKGLFLLCLPLVLLPILALVAKNVGPTESPQEMTKGLNLELPSPQLGKGQKSKADAYLEASKEMKASKDLEEWPLPEFLNQPMPSAESHLSPFGAEMRTVSSSSIRGERTKYQIPSEREMTMQLKELESLLAGQGQEVSSSSWQSVEVRPSKPNPELDQLQQLMEQIQKSKAAPDPEIQQLEGLMDKILQLQFPDKYPKESITKESDILPLPVDSGILGEPLTDQFPSLESEEAGLNGFFGLEAGDRKDVIKNGFRKTIAATVGKTQEIVPGDALELVLEEDLSMGGALFEKGTVLYSSTQLEAGRLQVRISGIIRDGDLIPVSLRGYGLDGIPGIALSDMKGASQWVRSSGQGTESIQLNSMGMDWQSQLANSGIQATRSLLRTKSRLRKIEIKSGHPLLLIDSSTSKSQVP